MTPDGWGQPATDYSQQVTLGTGTAEPELVSDDASGVGNFKMTILVDFAGFNEKKITLSCPIDRSKSPAEVECRKLASVDVVR
jgi:hypothetical protein